MKSEMTNTVLNLVLAVLVISGVFFALWTIQRTREFRELNPVAVQANAKLMMMQSFVNDVNAYNNQVKSPEITRMLQPLMTKPAAH
jgi:preprotein translocase subunit SecF